MNESRNNILIKIFEKERCCGCGACEAICPVEAVALIIDSDGFYYPQIDEKKCVGCMLCKTACAFSN